VISTSKLFPSRSTVTSTTVPGTPVRRSMDCWSGSFLVVTPSMAMMRSPGMIPAW